jgi:hypothetical protein
VTGAARPDKAASRQRLAEALRANLGRRKAQKRERAKGEGMAAVQDETAQDEAVQSEAMQDCAITRVVPPPED